MKKNLILILTVVLLLSVQPVLATTTIRLTSKIHPSYILNEIKFPKEKIEQQIILPGR